MEAGRGREKGRREEREGNGRRREREGKREVEEKRKGREGKRKKLRDKEYWECVEGNQVSGNFIHP